MDIINTWQFNIIGFLITVVIYFQYYKLAVRNATKDGAATVLLQVIAGMSALVLSPLFLFQFPSTPGPYLMLLIACIFYAVFDRFQTTVRKHLEVSVFSILNQCTMVFLVLFGIAIFQEPFIATKMIGAALILMGNVLVFYKRGGLRLNAYALLGIVSTLIIAIAISIDVQIASEFNLPLYIAITLLVPALMLMLVERHSFTELQAEFKPGLRRYYIITGIAWAAQIVFSLRSFQLATVSMISPLQASAVILNVLVAYIFLKERTDPIKKIIAALMVMVGVILTAIF